MSDVLFIGSITIPTDKLLKMISDNLANYSPFKINNNIKITKLQINNNGLIVEVESSASTDDMAVKAKSFVIPPTKSTIKQVCGGTTIRCDSIFDAELDGEILLTTYQVETLLCMTEGQLHNLRNKNEGPKFIKEGQKKYWYKVNDVRQWLNARHLKAV